jgi:hypothetical protein
VSEVDEDDPALLYSAALKLREVLVERFSIFDFRVLIFD